MVIYLWGYILLGFTANRDSLSPSTLLCSDEDSVGNFVGWDLILNSSLHDSSVLSGNGIVLHGPGLRDLLWELCSDKDSLGILVGWDLILLYLSCHWDRICMKWPRIKGFTLLGVCSDVDCERIFVSWDLILLYLSCHWDQTCTPWPRIEGFILGIVLWWRF